MKKIVISLVLTFTGLAVLAYYLAGFVLLFLPVCSDIVYSGVGFIVGVLGMAEWLKYSESKK